MKKTISIEGMNCGHCTSSVDKALRAVPGIQQVAVDLASKTAVVEADASVSDDVLTKTVTDAGFRFVDIR
jgi:copper chaperone CopZ